MSVVQLSSRTMIALDLVMKELNQAVIEFGPMKSLHEAVSIIQEEFEEFKETVYRKGFTKEQTRAELVQLAAMAIRALVDGDMV